VSEFCANRIHFRGVNNCFDGVCEDYEYWMSELKTPAK